MSDWKERTIGQICLVKGGKRLPAGKEFADGVTPYPYLRVTDMVDGTINSGSLVYVKPEIEPQIRNYKISKNDLYVTIAGTLGLFGTIPDYLDNSQLTENAAKLCEIDYTEIDKEFLKYYLNSEQTQSQIRKEIGVGGGVPKLALFRIEKLIIKYPDKATQNKIAHILKTLDSIIHKTQAIIDKYNSIKQGMLHDLFTRGIDINTGKLRPKYEDAPHLYKDSKLGWIPREWETKNIIETTYIKGRIGWEGLRADEFIEEGPYLITGTDINNGKINWSKSYRISESRFNRSPNIHVKESDVLITKDGTIGKTAFVENCPKKVILNSGLFILRCKDESYINKYLFYILNSFYFDNFIRTSLGGSTIVHLYQRSFEKFRFPIPHKYEQEVIIRFIDELIRNIENEKFYLYELFSIKQGLMTDLLCGIKQIKV